MRKFTPLLLGFIFLNLFNSQNTLAQCDCDFTIPAGSGTYTFDGTTMGAQPGDVICLAAGVRERITFRNLLGSPTDYIIIKNCGGQTLLGGPNANNAITLNRSRYFRITGTGDAGFEYGIKITETKAGSQGIQAYDKSSDMTFDHLEITKVGFAGIMAKTDPSKTCSEFEFERPHFTLFNVEIFHNYVHDITGEGFYIGNSFYTGNTVYCGSMQYPHEVRGVKIYDNLLSSTGWEAIQVGAGVNNVEIFNNRIFNYGAANIPQQNGGIQMGIGTAAKVYNNFIKSGTGIAILVQGIGNDFVYNNVIVNSGTYAILMSLRPTPLLTDIVPQTFVGPVGIINNTIVNPGPNDAVVKESVVGPLGNVMFNNLVVGGQSNWLKLRGDTDWTTGNNVYIPLIADAKFVNPALDDYRLQPGSPAINAGRDVSAWGVTFDFDNTSRPSGANWDLGAFELGGNQKPVVTVGSNQTLTLPTNSTTITGSATDSDGSIASYLWTKQNGPAATLSNQATTTLSLTDLVEGVYTFRLTATDNEGETGFRDVTITVIDPSVNQPPVAISGGNKTITLPVSTTVLTGSGTDSDGSVVTYSWVKVNGPAATLANENTAVLTLTGLVQGNYVFRLTVTDDDGATDTDDATVIVNPAAANQSPTASAGADRNLVLPTNSVNLSGSGNDPDGSISTYLWTKQSGPAATLTNSNTPTLQLTGLVLGTYTFRLTVTDNLGATAFDEAIVTVTNANQAPVAAAGVDKTIQLPTNSTTLTGSGSDSDGSVVSYSWTKVNGPVTGTLTNANTNVLTLAGLVQGIYTLRLTVTDDDGATDTDDAIVTVEAANVPPIANAGPARTITLPVNSTTLNGSGSDSDGSVASYLWEKMSGPTAVLTGASTPTLSLTNLVQGAYTFRITVTDNDGATTSSQTTVTVLPAATNQAPIANAGSDFGITLPTNSADIIGSGTDADGSVTGYNWIKVGGPSATLTGTTLPTLSLTSLVAGTYIFRLTVTDNLGATASDDVTLLVSNVNQVPTVVASNDEIITLPNSSTSLVAVALDPDGTIANYLWTTQSGPNSPTLTGITTNTLNASNLIAGTYIFRITVTDDDGATAFDQVNVIVQTSSNINPVANAGSDITIFLPTNSVTINGSGSDSDGSISSYAWTQIAGTAATLTNSNTSTLTASGLVAGTYSFRLMVTDNVGGTGISDVNVTVNPSSTNQSPIANAGPDIALTLPNNTTNLIGSGSDANGSIASYNWIKLSGPTATLTNENTAVLSLQDLIAGVYQFRLTVTDNDGASGSDNIQVTVFPETVNQSPSVNAGANITITLPTNTATLNAIASDPDGSIAVYTWTKQIGPTATLGGETTSSLLLTNLVVGTYAFRITVTDDDGDTAIDEVTVTVLPLGSNSPPLVNADIDKTIFLPTNSINLAGSAADADGSIASYLWTKMSGPTATLANQTSPNLTLSNLVAGQYLFRLTATDNLGAVGFDETSVTVFPGTVNQAPIANSGANQTIVLPNNSTSLSGSGFDPDGSIVSYAWTQLLGPATTLVNVNSPTLLIEGLVVGTYQFQLTVTDDDGATGSSVSQIIVVAEGANLPPIANAGFDQVINLPQNSLDIQGNGTDTDGSITGFAWTKKSGPATGTLTNENTSKVSLSDLVAGTYVFTLTVTDDDGLTNNDDVRVTVIQGTVNNNPVVNAGVDITVRLPSSSANLTATATDVDGSISSILWTKESGPAATLAGETTNTLSLSGLVLGTYVFRAEATDNSGSTAADDVVVTVLPAGANNPPNVLAGSARVLSLPTTTTTLNGSASDPDGSVQQVSWTLQSGPNTPQLTGANTTTLNIQNLILGTYTFRLTATDNEGATAFSQTTVTLLADHQPPTVFAGNDTTLVLPNNFMPLVGEITQGDGPISEVIWIQTAGTATTIVGEYPDLALVDLLPGNYSFQITVTDNIGAQSSDEFSVEVIEGESNPIGAALFLTPNADGINDFWNVKNASMIEGCPLRIFNSLGKTVYTTDQYLNDWNGSTSTTGQNTKDGDYYFVFECGSKKTYSGAFRLMR